jgi:hypothetical protein
MMGDIQVVGQQSGEDSLGMVHKQVRSIGNRSMPAMAFIDTELTPITAATTQNKLGNNVNITGLGALVLSGDGSPDITDLSYHIQIWATTTDAGSDEAKARRLRQVLSKDNMYHWEFDGDCLAHQYHLIVGGLLRQLDRHMITLGSPTKYWATLAKFVHVWRDNATEVFQAFRRLYGDEVVFQYNIASLCVCTIRVLTTGSSCLCSQSTANTAQWQVGELL